MVTPKPRTDILKLIQHLKAHGSVYAPPANRSSQTLFANMHNIPPEELYAGDMVWADDTAVNNLAHALADLAQENPRLFEDLCGMTAYRVAHQFGRPLMHVEYNTWLDEYLAEGAVPTSWFVLEEEGYTRECLAFEPLDMRFIDDPNSLPAHVAAVDNVSLIRHVLVSRDIDLGKVPLAQQLNNDNIHKHGILKNRHSSIQLYGWADDGSGVKKPVMYPSQLAGGKVFAHAPLDVARDAGHLNVQRAVSELIDQQKCRDESNLRRFLVDRSDLYDDATRQLHALSSVVRDGCGGWRAADIAAYREWVTDRLKLPYEISRGNVPYCFDSSQVYSCNKPGTLNPALEHIGNETPKGSHFEPVCYPAIIIAKPGVADLNKISFPHRDNIKREYMVCGWGEAYPHTRRLRHHNTQYYNPCNVSIYPNLLSPKSLELAFTKVLNRGWVSQQLPPNHRIFELIDERSPYIPTSWVS